MVSLVLCVQSHRAESALVLNEIVASNGSILADEDGDYPDWIELYNPGPDPVDLTGWGLSDRADQPFRWEFESGEVDPDEYVLVWASGKDRRSITNGNQYHANFSISSAGEDILLTRPNGQNADWVLATPIPRDISLGRQPDGVGSWRYFPDPTPNAPNVGPSYSDLLDPPTLSQPAGFYVDPVTLAVSHDMGGVTVRYTLDGSVPTEVDPIFPASLVIHTRSGESNYLSAIDTTFSPSGSSYDYWEPPTGLVRKATTVRIRAFGEDALPSSAVTATYFVGPEYIDEFSLPVMALTVEEDDFFDSETGIYVAGDVSAWQDANYTQRGEEWERPIHIEYLTSTGGVSFVQDAGVRIHGGWTRRFGAKSLRLYARSRYGSDSFPAEILPAEPGGPYRRLILRHSGNDFVATMFRDAFIQRLVSHMNVETQAYNPVVVFLNGEYWGIHNVRERYDRHYLARVYGVDEDQLDILTARHGIGDLIVKEGDANHYAAMRGYIVTNSVVDAHHYEYIQTQMDVDNYLDYLVAKIYVNNWDWPGNNIDYWRVRTDEYLPDAPDGHDGRWRWLFYDADYGFWLHNENRALPSHNTLAFATQPGLPLTFWPNPGFSTFLPRKMLENETFRHRFINRMCDQINTAFQPDHVVAVIDEMSDRIAAEMPEHIQRHNLPAGGMVGWSNRVQRLLDFAEQRPAHQRSHLVSHFGLPGLAELTVDVSDPTAGIVQVNTIQIDGDTLGLDDPGQPYPWTGTYVRDVPIDLRAIPLPGHRFVGWRLEGEEELLATEPELALELDDDLSLEALFEFMPPIQVFPVPRQSLVESAPPHALSLSTLFAHPDPLSYSVQISHSNKVDAAIVDDELWITPHERGQGWVTITATDGVFYTETNEFHVLVYPAAYDVASGPFVFREWDADKPDGAYPANMVFVQGEQNDSGLTTSLLHAYSLRAEDYHANDQGTIGFPYNNTGRTRINGLGEDGIAFINTGQGRDLGGAIVAVDTRGLTNAWVRWLCGTVLPNSRIYAIRLQYRVGGDGEFVDVLDDHDQPVEYIRNSNAGHTQSFGPVALPETALDQEYVQLLWRYYRVSGTSGPRAQLRLDEILVHDDSVTANTGTPLWWLASHGLTNGSYEAAALSVPAGGTLPAWKAYVADLDPMDLEAELPQLSVDGGVGEWAVELDPLSTNRWYTIQKTQHLVAPDWLPISSGQGESAFADVDFDLPSNGPLFLRVLISVP